MWSPGSYHRRRMGSSTLEINHSVLLGLDDSECLWGLGMANLTGSVRLEEGPSTHEAESTADDSGSKESSTLRSLNYGLPGLVVVSSVLAFFVVATAFGNCLVIVALFRYRSLRTISNFLIGNLALSDFLLAVTILPLSSVNECLGHWVFGRLACNLWLTLDVLYCTASIWNLCMIAFDRFTATLYPLWYHEKRSTKQAAVYALLIWSISGAICVPPSLGWGELSQNYFFNNSTNVFECVLFQSPGYVLYSASGSFYIPFFITFFLYVRIFSLLRKRMRRMRRGWKPGARRCLGCCAGERFPSSAEQNGYPVGGQSAVGSSAPRKPRYIHPRIDARMCLDVPKTDTAADASTTKACSSCRSPEEDEVMLPPFSSWSPKSKAEVRPGFSNNIRTNSDSRLPVPCDQLPFDMVLNGVASPIDSASQMFQEQGKDSRVPDPGETDPCSMRHAMNTKTLDSVSEETKTAQVRRSLDSNYLKCPAQDFFVAHLPVSGRLSNPERTSVSAIPSFLLLPATAAYLATPRPTAQNCSSRRKPCGPTVSAGGTRNRCGDEGVKCWGVGGAVKEGGKMGVALGGGRTASCLTEGVNTSSNGAGDMQVGVASNVGVDVGVTEGGPTEDLSRVQKKGLNVGEVVSEGGRALCVKTENRNLGVATGVARSVSADSSLVKREWDLSGLGSGDGQTWVSAKNVGVATGVARVVVGGTLGGAAPGLCRRKRRRRPDLREMNATIKMAIIIAFFCGMWMGFFVVYVVRGWCPVSCHVPRKLEAFFFWLGYSNSSMNPILYTLFNDDFRKAFQKLLGCYVRKNGSRNSRF